MKLEFREIKDRNTTEERVVLVAQQDCDLKYYFLFTTQKVPDNKISTSVKHPFWLPSKEVKKGDLIVVYSKAGTGSFKINDDKTTSHFYFRGLKAPILLNNDLVLVIEVNTWKAEGF